MPARSARAPPRSTPGHRPEDASRRPPAPAEPKGHLTCAGLFSWAWTSCTCWRPDSLGLDSTTTFGLHIFRVSRRAMARATDHSRTQFRVARAYGGIGSSFASSNLRKYARSLSRNPPVRGGRKRQEQRTESARDADWETARSVKDSRRRSTFQKCVTCPDLVRGHSFSGKIEKKDLENEPGNSS